MVARRWCLLVAVACCQAWCMAAAGQSTDFRLDTELFVEDDSRPVGENRTLFVGDRVYDFSLKDGQITILDVKGNQFILLDPGRKLKTTIDTLKIYETTDEIRQRLLDSQRAVEPAEYAVSEDQGWIVVRGEPLQYRAKGVKPEGESPATKAAAVRYQQFADWYARLNAMRQGNPPPFGRIRLNAELAQRQMLPEEVQRTIGFRPRLQRAKARHLVVWDLSAKDRKWIETAGEQIASFEMVGADVFFFQPNAGSAKKD
jgi:hypothetical protein